MGHALASHPKVGMVSLTGSVEGGVAVMRAAADNVTKVSLELGGKAPAIVMARCGPRSGCKGHPRFPHHQYRPGLQLRRARLCA